MNKVFWEGVDEVGEEGKTLPTGKEELMVELVVEEQDCRGDPTKVSGETRHDRRRRGWGGGWNCFCPAQSMLIQASVNCVQCSLRLYGNDNLSFLSGWLSGK